MEHQGLNEVIRVLLDPLKQFGVQLACWFILDPLAYRDPVLLDIGEGWEPRFGQLGIYRLLVFPDSRVELHFQRRGCCGLGWGGWRMKQDGRVRLMINGSRIEPFSEQFAGFDSGDEIFAIEQAGPVFTDAGDMPVLGEIEYGGEFVIESFPLGGLQSDLFRFDHRASAGGLFFRQIVMGFGAQSDDDVAGGLQNRIHQGVVFWGDIPPRRKTVVEFFGGHIVHG